jgi:ribose transport system ATP-binding protein
VDRSTAAPGESASQESASRESASRGPADLVLRLEGISKSFGASRALDDVTLEIAPGVVRALLGQNGSGKSTIVKILTGFYVADAGRLWLWDHYEPMPLRGLSGKGIAVIHQDLGLVRNQTTLENFCVGSAEWGSYLRPIRWSEERRRFTEYAERLGFAGLAAKEGRTILEVSPSERTVVAVMRALRHLDDAARRSAQHGGESQPRALILDEPTVFFGDRERRLLGELLEALTASRVGVLMISHDFHDVFEFAREVSVLRDGRVVAERRVSEATEEDLVRAIVGREVIRTSRVRRTGVGDEVAIEFRGVESDQLHGFDLDVRRGEIVGVTGLAGMGHEELPYVAAGLRRVRAGTIRVRHDGKLVTLETARQAVGLVPSDRTGSGVWLDGTVRENLTIGRTQRYARRGLVQKGRERAAAVEVISRYGVVVQGPESQLWTLSGGNQQKVLVARVLSDDVGVLVLDEPIQGVDVGAGQQLIELIVTAVDEGLGVLLVSIDHDLLARVCDRVAVLREGSLRRVLDGDDVNVETILGTVQASGPIAAERDGDGQQEEPSDRTGEPEVGGVPTERAATRS